MKFKSLCFNGILTVFFFIALSTTMLAAGSNTKATQTLIFVPGFLHEVNDTFASEKQIVKDIFPHATIEVFVWEEAASDTYFPDCCKKVDRVVAQKLVKYITDKYSVEEMKNIILVGHSLGGRTVIKAMALLAKAGKKINCGIFLGSAISYEDPDVKQALNASIERCINIFSRNDPILNKFYGISSNENALGAYGYKFNSNNLRQYKTDIDEHDAVCYLPELKKVKAGTMAEYKRPPEVKVRYQIFAPFKFPHNKENIVESVNGWHMWKKEHKYYIIDHDGFCRAWGNEEKMREAFDDIKKQLNNKNQ